METKFYHPEMNETKPAAQIEVTLSYNGKHYFLKTQLTLTENKGYKAYRQIIRKDGSVWNQYKVTEAAYEKIKKQYSTSYELLLD